MTKSPIISLALLALLTTPPAVAAENEWKTWSDSKFGYSMSYPDHFWAYSLADANDGITLYGGNDETSLAIWGQFNVLDADGCKQLERQKEELAHIVPGSEMCWAGGYTLTVTDDGGRTGIEHHTLQYGLVTPDTIAAFSYTYRADESAVLQERLARMKEGLKVADAQSLPAKDISGRDISNWQAPYRLLEDGNFALAGSDDTPLGKAEDVRNSDTLVWFAVSSETRGAAEADYGLYFADRDLGSVVSFLPCADAIYAGEVKMSLGGDYFIADFGTTPVRELRVYDFGSLQLRQTFVGMAANWLDNWRFVFTRAEDEKRSSGEPALSVVVYDVGIADLQYIRKAGPDTDFINGEPDLENELIKMDEQNVGSGTTRSLTAPFPSAG